jgi:hypothetical protein
VVIQHELKCAVRSLSGIAGPDRSQLTVDTLHSESSFDYPQRHARAGFPRKREEDSVGPAFAGKSTMKRELIEPHAWP